MNRVVLGVLQIGATLLVMSIGIMIIGASIILLIISLPFPGLRKFVPDIGAFVDILAWALRGILFAKIEQDGFRNGEVQDDILDEWSDTTDRPRHLYTEPYPYAPHPEKPIPYHTFHHEPQTEPVYYAPGNPSYAPHYKELKKEPHHNGQEYPKPLNYQLDIPFPAPSQANDPVYGGSSGGYSGGYCGVPNREPQFRDELNKIVRFNLPDQTEDSD